MGASDESFPTSRATVRPLAWVSLHVASQIRVGTEFNMAQGATVGFLTCVNYHVLDKVGFLSKFFTSRYSCEASLLCGYACGRSCFPPEWIPCRRRYTCAASVQSVSSCESVNMSAGWSFCHTRCNCGVSLPCAFSCDESEWIYSWNSCCKRCRCKVFLLFRQISLLSYCLHPSDILHCLAVHHHLFHSMDTCWSALMRHSFV